MGYLREKGKWGSPAGESSSPRGELAEGEAGSREEVNDDLWSEALQALSECYGLDVSCFPQVHMLEAWFASLVAPQVWQY